jgi:transcriptional regulator with GAF, ATPase, and Fis domain
LVGEGFVKQPGLRVCHEMTASDDACGWTMTIPAAVWTELRMSDDRERAVAEAFVSLATTLAEGYDVLELLSELTANCGQLLDIGSAGLLLADRNGVLHVLAASSEETRQLEIFQLQREQGPCLDCYRGKAPVLVESLIQEADRWPQFANAALTAGFRSVHAIPMRLGENVLGALGLFGSAAGALNDADLRLAQAFADVASVALIQGRGAEDQATVNQQLQQALNSRIVLEQAKGILAQLGDLDMNQAFACLRRYSRDHNWRLGELTAALVARELPASRVLEHVRTKQRDSQSS